MAWADLGWKLNGAIIGLALFILALVLYLSGMGFWPLGLLLLYAPSFIFAGITFVGVGFFIGWLVDSIRNETPAFTCFVISLAAAFGVLVAISYSLGSAEFATFRFLLSPFYIVWTIVALTLPNLISWLYTKLVGESAVEYMTKGFFAGLITGIVFLVALLIYTVYYIVSVEESISSVLIGQGAVWSLIAAVVVPIAIASLIGWIVSKIRVKRAK